MSSISVMKVVYCKSKGFVDEEKHICTVADIIFEPDDAQRKQEQMLFHSELILDARQNLSWSPELQGPVWNSAPAMLALPIL